MKLNKEQQQMLEGKHGRGARKAVEILVAYGECYNAERMIPVTRNGDFVKLNADEGYVEIKKKQT